MEVYNHVICANFAFGNLKTYKNNMSLSCVMFITFLCLRFIYFFRVVMQSLF